MAKLLEIKNLQTYFFTEEGVVRAVDWPESVEIPSALESFPFRDA